MVVAEAQRTYTYLRLFGYATDLVVANRMVTSDVTDPYFAAWKDAQAGQLRKIREGFHPLPVKTVPLFGNEVVGLEVLRDNPSSARLDEASHLLTIRFEEAAVAAESGLGRSAPG
jgi:arsenite/tail-anchored protein-transporting ATPase